MLIRVTDETGAPIPGVAVKASKVSAVSDDRGMARFPDLYSGQYSVDAELPGFKSCGPLTLAVQGRREVSETLVMRVGTISDGAIIVGEGETARAQPYSEVEFKPCPGRPNSAVVIPLTRVQGKAE